MPAAGERVESFDPEMLAIIEGVFDEAWASLAIQKQSEPLREALAARIMSLALRGERNPARLLDHSLADLQTMIETAA